MFDTLNEDEVVQKTAGQVKCDIDVEDIEVDTAKVDESIDEDCGPTCSDRGEGLERSAYHVEQNGGDLHHDDPR